jgi:hypothetical protein
LKPGTWSSAPSLLKVQPWKGQTKVLARDDNRVLAHVSAEEVVRLRNLRLVAEEEPAAGEDFLQLLLVDFRVGINAAVDAPLLD